MYISLPVLAGVRGWTQIRRHHKKFVRVVFSVKIQAFRGLDLTNLLKRTSHPIGYPRPTPPRANAFFTAIYWEEWKLPTSIQCVCNVVYRQ
jgi:hypothetical protein